jgi:hypothetical protein
MGVGVSYAEALDGVRRAQARIYDVRDPRTVPKAADVRRVVVIVASSRGGSSLLFHLLRRTGAFACLEGEHTHLYKLYGLGLPDWPDAHDGDIASAADVDGFLTALLAEATVPGAAEQVVADEYAGRVTRRLMQQWPGLASHADDLMYLVRRHLSVVSLDAEVFDHEDFLLGILAELRRLGQCVDPRYYDVSAPALAIHFPRLPPASGPPPGAVGTIEEPPFILPAPAPPATASHLTERPLLLKASVDAYRIDLLTKLVSVAEVYFIHLLRNPAAAINGLYDGWRDRGFFSHRLTGRAVLNMRGYSESPWGSDWWNFDLPPQWTRVVSRPLPEVCAFQWHTAHRSILDSLAASAAPRMNVRAEDLMSGRVRRTQAIEDILQFCQARARPVAEQADRVVMATAPPRPGRWRERMTLLRSVVAEPAVREVASRLGYGSALDVRWI